MDSPSPSPLNRRPRTLQLKAPTFAKLTPPPGNSGRGSNVGGESGFDDTASVGSIASSFLESHKPHAHAAGKREQQRGVNAGTSSQGRRSVSPRGSRLSPSSPRSRNGGGGGGGGTSSAKRSPRQHRADSTEGDDGPDGRVLPVRHRAQGPSIGGLADQPLDNLMASWVSSRKQAQGSGATSPIERSRVLSPSRSPARSLERTLNDEHDRDEQRYASHESSSPRGGSRRRGHDGAQEDDDTVSVLSEVTYTSTGSMRRFSAPDIEAAKDALFRDVPTPLLEELEASRDALSRRPDQSQSRSDGRSPSHESNPSHPRPSPRSGDTDNRQAWREGGSDVPLVSTSDLGPVRKSVTPSLTPSLALSAATSGEAGSSIPGSSKPYVSPTSIARRRQSMGSGTTQSRATRSDSLISTISQQHVPPGGKVVMTKSGPVMMVPIQVGPAGTVTPPPPLPASSKKPARRAITSTKVVKRPAARRASTASSVRSGTGLPDFSNVKSTGYGQKNVRRRRQSTASVKSRGTRASLGSKPSSLSHKGDDGPLSAALSRRLSGPSAASSRTSRSVRRHESSASSAPSASSASSAPSSGSFGPSEFTALPFDSADGEGEDDEETLFTSAAYSVSKSILSSGPKTVFEPSQEQAKRMEFFSKILSRPVDRNVSIVEVQEALLSVMNAAALRDTYGTISDLMSDVEMAAECIAEPNDGALEQTVSCLLGLQEAMKDQVKAAKKAVQRGAAGPASGLEENLGLDDGRRSASREFLNPSPATTRAPSRASGASTANSGADSSVFTSATGTTTTSVLNISPASYLFPSGEAPVAYFGDHDFAEANDTLEFETTLESTLYDDEFIDVPATMREFPAEVQELFRELRDTWAEKLKIEEAYATKVLAEKEEVIAGVWDDIQHLLAMVFPLLTDARSSYVGQIQRLSDMARADNDTEWKDPDSRTDIRWHAAIRLYNAFCRHAILPRFKLSAALPKKLGLYLRNLIKGATEEEREGIDSLERRMHNQPRRKLGVIRERRGSEDGSDDDTATDRRSGLEEEEKDTDPCEREAAASSSRRRGEVDSDDDHDDDAGGERRHRGKGAEVDDLEDDSSSDSEAEETCTQRLSEFLRDPGVWWAGFHQQFKANELTLARRWWRRCERGEPAAEEELVKRFRTAGKKWRKGKVLPAWQDNVTGSGSQWGGVNWGEQVSWIHQHLYDSAKAANIFWRDFAARRSMIRGVQEQLRTDIYSIMMYVAQTVNKLQTEGLARLEERAKKREEQFRRDIAEVSDREADVCNRLEEEGNHNPSVLIVLRNMAKRVRPTQLTIHQRAIHTHLNRLRPVMDSVKQHALSNSNESTVAREEERE